MILFVYDSTHLHMSARSPEPKPQLKPLLKLCLFFQEEANGSQPWAI